VHLTSSEHSNVAGSNDPFALHTEVDIPSTECPSAQVTLTWSVKLYPSVFMPFSLPLPINFGDLAQTILLSEHLKSALEKKPSF